MNRSLFRHAARSFTVVALGILPGCESITEKLTEKAMEVAVEKAIESQSGGEVDIDTNGDGVTFKAKDDKGKTVTFQSQTGKLPERWPSDIPSYPGAKVSASMMSDKGGMLMLESTDAPDKVIAFYRSKLSQMKETSELNLENATMLTFQEAKGPRTLALSTSKQDDKTAIHLQLVEKNE